VPGDRVDPRKSLPARWTQGTPGCADKPAPEISATTNHPTRKHLLPIEPLLYISPKNPLDAACLAQPCCEKENTIKTSGKGEGCWRRAQNGRFFFGMEAAGEMVYSAFPHDSSLRRCVGASVMYGLVNDSSPGDLRREEPASGFRDRMEGTQ
jgi:hypothetical protein